MKIVSILAFLPLVLVCTHILLNGVLKVWGLSRSTVKLGLMTTTKRRPPLIGPYFLYRYTIIKQCLKYNHLSSMTSTIPNLDRRWQKCFLRQQHNFCAACFATSDFFPATSAKVSTKNLFKKTTCLRWTLYIGPEGGCLRQVWLYTTFLILLVNHFTRFSLSLIRITLSLTLS